MTATRTVAAMQRMAVSIAQLMGMHPEVWLRYLGNGAWEAYQVGPEVWFGEPFLSSWLVTPWSRRGDCITLTAANGTWIWRLTGETVSAENIDGPFMARRAVWPD